ncbi:hypothetical protein SLEP1_g32540 [Rubroshorea leprosula]|uniref:Uncharacterized protein n=1 Tax=Rubroshorea leprosula TaxID=152421 RepID=A0AAV5KDM5_9ROSI|nr:hypothetical protein SLEP1_g32540 [Rubroshorea leprosula]
MDSIQHRILALMKNVLMHLVKDDFGDDEYLEKFHNILWKRDGTAFRNTLLKLVLVELLPILGGNVLFYLCKMLIPLSFDSLVVRPVVRWTLLRVVKYCFNYWIEA